MDKTHRMLSAGTATGGTGELDVLLEVLGKAGFLFHAFRVDRHGPEVLAAVFEFGGIADVVILHTEQYAAAYRAPIGPGIDEFAPTHVYWSYASSPVWTLRALLTLAAPGQPDAPSEVAEAPPGLGLPTTGRLPVRMRKRTQRPSFGLKANNNWNRDDEIG
jgi:hypothetical protein